MSFDFPKIEQVSEDRRRAEAFIWSTIDSAPEPFAPDMFFERLQEQVKTLPRYRKMMEALKDVPDERLFQEVFNAVSRRADHADEIEDGPDDGVLVSSMRHGHLECAGRVMIASTYLSERGVPHAIAQPPGHSMMIHQVDEDTMAYADPNNDLYFTFPKNALRGYEDVNVTADCSISEYVPREKDIVDGVGSAFDRFLVSSPKRSILESYLGNVQAALAGHEEFNDSGFIKDERVADEVGILKEGVCDAGMSVWNDRLDELEKELAVRETLAKETFAAVVRKGSDEQVFAANLLSAIDGPLAARYPYLRHASDGTRTAWVKKIWQQVQAHPDLAERILNAE